MWSNRHLIRFIGPLGGQIDNFNSRQSSGKRSSVKRIKKRTLAMLDGCIIKTQPISAFWLSISNSWLSLSEKIILCEKGPGSSLTVGVEYCTNHLQLLIEWKRGFVIEKKRLKRSKISVGCWIQIDLPQLDRVK